MYSKVLYFFCIYTPVFRWDVNVYLLSIRFMSLSVRLSITNQRNNSITALQDRFIFGHRVYCDKSVNAVENQKWTNNLLYFFSFRTFRNPFRKVDHSNSLQLEQVCPCGCFDRVDRGNTKRVWWLTVAMMTRTSTMSCVWSSGRALECISISNVNAHFPTDSGPTCPSVWKRWRATGSENLKSAISPRWLKSGACVIRMT